ncbi:MAG: hypothetical protein EZS28_011037 [Streblomastix strix]|uniref:Uncharacterized protein n=1 Tax=Streblomastix strix TaxID=222440 RepID=A0A5J4WEN9_9EUKA|nr:MAG: hypothetical protein EZS28_011037 [Streblomastix strix]
MKSSPFRCELRLSQYYVLTTPLMIAADATDKRDNYARTPLDLSVFSSMWNKRLRCIVQSDLLFADWSLALEHMAVNIFKILAVHH